MNNKLQLLIIALFTSILFACNDSKHEVLTDQTSNDLDEIYSTRSSQLKREFGKAFSSALGQSKALRVLLKTEALKMFNKDYEVLFLLIKDQQLENGVTVEALLSELLGGNDKLQEIIQDDPSLTIFIPELPENSFSAQIWDTDNDIPMVAIRTNQSNNIPVINVDGTEDIIPAHLIPGSPTLVVKTNERVISNQKSSDFDIYTTRIIYTDKNLKLRFWADGFDGMSNSQPVANRLVLLSIDPKIEEAYDIYQNQDGWHRDYIYYNIQPSQTRGQFDYDFKEHITTFRMEGDAMNAYNRISDQTEDPEFVPLINGDNTEANHWSDGFYEIKVIAQVNGDNGVGQIITKGFSLSPSKLFKLTYRKQLFFYILEKVELQTEQNNIKVPIINWDLDNYSAAMKLRFEEVDISETITETETFTSEFATNFSINPTFGFLEKVGLKFGASLKETRTQSVSRAYTLGSDILYDEVVNFADDVLLVRQEFSSPFIPDVYITREYSTGFCRFSIEPLRVQ